MRRFMTMSVLALVLVVVVLPTLLTRFLVNRPGPELQVDGADGLTVHVYFPETRRIEQMPLGEYLKGVVAAEMPPEFASEALKAQFIAARTYAVKRMQQFNGPGNGGCPLNPKADVCADHATSQAYMSREQTEQKLGKLAAANLWKRLDHVQAETEGLVITYEGKLIDPLYHSVSGTVTEDAGDYYTQSVPYLKPVDDRWGADSPKLNETRKFTLEELARALSTQNQAVSAAAIAGRSKTGSAPVEILSRTAAKRVKSVRVGPLVLSGREFREQLGLRSTNFAVTVQGSQVIISTVGYGHGLGMSQYGADGMARSGKTAAQILMHYYSGATISRLFEE